MFDTILYLSNNNNIKTTLQYKGIVIQKKYGPYACIPSEI